MPSSADNDVAPTLDREQHHAPANSEDDFSFLGEEERPNEQQVKRLIHQEYERMMKAQTPTRFSIAVAATFILAFALLVMRLEQIAQTNIEVVTKLDTLQKNVEKNNEDHKELAERISSWTDYTLLAMKAQSEVVSEMAGTLGGEQVVAEMLQSSRTQDETNNALREMRDAMQIQGPKIDFVIRAKKEWEMHRSKIEHEMVAPRQKQTKAQFEDERKPALDVRSETQTQEDGKKKEMKTPDNMKKKSHSEGERYPATSERSQKKPKRQAPAAKTEQETKMFPVKMQPTTQLTKANPANSEKKSPVKKERNDAQSNKKKTQEVKTGRSETPPEMKPTTSGEIEVEYPSMFALFCSAVYAVVLRSGDIWACVFALCMVGTVMVLIQKILSTIGIMTETKEEDTPESFNVCLFFSLCFLAVSYLLVFGGAATEEETDDLKIEAQVLFVLLVSSYVTASAFLGYNLFG